MSKTSRKSLPTLILAVCLLASQALLFSQSSNVHALTGRQIFANPSTLTFGSDGSVTVVGTGFNPNGRVLLTFNAPYSADGSPTSARTIPPTVNRPGDNRPTPPQDQNQLNGYPNVLEVLANTDANGNIVASDGSNGGVRFEIPRTAVDGVYQLYAYDLVGAAGTGTQVTISRAPTQQLSVTPVSGSSAQIGGELNVTALPNSFNNGDQIEFDLEDFLGSASFGTPTQSFQTFNGLVANSNPAIPTGAVTRLPLRIVNCGTTPVLANTATCQASINGDVAATVQLVPLPGVIAGRPETPYPCILSTYYYDQVYAIVARDTGPGAGGLNPSGLPSSGRQVEAGFHLDHGQTQLTLSTNQQPVNGSVVVSGTGFGAFAQVNLYFISLNIPTAGTPALPTGTPVITGIPNPPNPTTPYTNGSFASSNLLSGGIVTDGNGAFTQSVSLPSTVINNLGVPSSSNAGYPGFIIAEDFGGSGTITGINNTTVGIYNCPGARLNEAATSPLTFTTLTAGTLTIVPQFPVAVAAAGLSTPTAAISSTVTVTGTGFIANEAVSVSLAGPGSSGNLLQLGAPVPPPGAVGCAEQVIVTLRANALGVATGSFLIPETCNTVTVSSGFINAGAAVTVNARGQQSGLKDTNTLNIPKTSVLIAPVPPTTTAGGSSLTSGGANNGNPIPIALTGTGFAAGEPVTFQFGLIDPFSGAINQGSPAAFTVSTVADGTGTASVTSQSLPSGLQGGLYTLIGRGLASSFSSAVSNTLPFVFINGNLNCPTSVLPGQPFAISGTNFAANTPLQVSINFVSTAGIPTPVLIGSGSLAPGTTVTIGGVVLSGSLVSTVLTDANGTFVVTPTVPFNTALGNYLVTVSGLVANGSTAASNNFQPQIRQCQIGVVGTTPAIQVSPTSGPIGITATVTGQNFGPNEPIVVSLQYPNTVAFSNTDVPGTATAVGNTNATGAFTAVVTIKSTINALSPGQYNITAIGQQTRLAARTPFIVTGGPAAVVTSVFFAEGYTGTIAGGANADFNESISILNSNNFTTTYTVNYFIENPVSGAASTTKPITGTIGPNSVVERSVNADVGLNVKVAAQVTSPVPLSAERIIARSISGRTLDSASSLGQQINTSATGTFSYYFATGAVQLTNEELLTLLNPTATSTTATINILPQAVISSTTVPTIAPITQVVPANSRVTVRIRALLVSSGIQKFGMTVSSTAPLAAERVDYFGDGIGSGKYGASTKPAGTTPFRQYIFGGNVGTFASTGPTNPAAGTFGTGKDLSEIDIINPGAAAAGSATVTVSFFDASGAPINSQQVQVDGGTRETINVNDVVGTQGNVFSAIVTSDKSVYVEKPIYYGGDPNLGGTHAVANPSGSPAGLTSVAFPYLDTASVTGTTISQTVFLYNPGATTITVRGIYSTNTQTVSKDYQVLPNRIVAVSVNADTATLPARAPLGGVFQIVTTGSGTGDAFVATSLSNAPDFSVVLGNQGTYPVGTVNQ